MDRWVWYAVASMAFAGATSVIAKRDLVGHLRRPGLRGPHGVRVPVHDRVRRRGGAAGRVREARLAGRPDPRPVAATTAASWVCYYRAIQVGEVATVNLIDKGSLVVAVFLAWLVLGETLTPRVLAGCALMVAGLIVASRR